MKTSFFAAAALWLSCSIASAQPAPGKTEAQLLFDKCRSAYANLTTYRGTVKTNGVSVSDGATSNYGGSATVIFKKPDFLRIDGKLAVGGDYSILGNREGAWYRWPLENGGKWKQAKELSLAVASMTGVAGGAPTTISFLLVPTLGANPFRSADNAKIEGEESIDGQICYKITARTAKKTTSWWINKKTLLLRRVFQSYDAKQSAAMLAETQKGMEEYAKQTGKPAPTPKIDLRFVSDTEDLKTESLDGAVDETPFQIGTWFNPWPQEEQ